MDIPFTVLIVNSATKDNVTYYLLQVSQDDNEQMSYAVDRRFTEFIDLDDKLRLIYGDFALNQSPKLPKKTFMRQSSDAFVKKRHYYLQQYINGLHQIPFLVQSKSYRRFLSIDKFFPSSIPIQPFLKFVQNKSQHGIRLSNFDMIMLSHNVFISISGCHPQIAFCSNEKIQSIFNQHNSSNKNKKINHTQQQQQHNNKSKDGAFNVARSPSSQLLSNGHHNSSPLMQAPHSPLNGGRIANDLTNSSSSSMLPAPSEWGGCIQIWYYDATAMNASSKSGFSWWLEERGDENENFYGWNRKKTLHDDEEKQTMDAAANYSYYGGQHVQEQRTLMVKEVQRELDCIFLNEVPTCLHHDREHQQLFVGTLMGNIHRFKIIHNAKIEATGILPNPNIYNNVSNIHSFCHSSIYDYIHHEELYKDAEDHDNQQRIHQRLYEQRELLKLKERQLHHKKTKKRRSLIPDNDAIYNKSVLNMQSYDGVLYVSDASANIHAFDIKEFKHLHYLSLDHYFIDILQTEYKWTVDEYYQKKLNEYRAQQEQMMIKSSQPKDIHRHDCGIFSPNTLSVPMRIGGAAAAASESNNSAYKMYFDELVFSTSINKQKEKIQNVTSKLNQNVICTDLVSFEDQLFIPTNLPNFSLSNLRYSDEFNLSRPHISNSADAIIVDEKEKEDAAAAAEIPNEREKEGMGCDNIFGTVSNFDANNDVLYSITSIHTIHKDFLICWDNDDNDMSTYHGCTIFVWSFTRHISVDLCVGNECTDSKNGAGAIKERTWHLKAKWFDETVNYVCKELSALTYCHSIKTLVVGGTSGYIALFDSIGICYNIFCAHTDVITKMIWLNDSNQLVSTGLDGTIKIWKLYHTQFADEDDDKHRQQRVMSINKESIDEKTTTNGLHHYKNNKSPTPPPQTIANRYIIREEPQGI